MLRHEIYRAAVSRFKQEHPALDARYYIASRLNMTYQALSAVLEGKAPLSTERFELLIQLTGFREAFRMYDEFLFPAQKPAKRKAS